MGRMSKAARLTVRWTWATVTEVEMKAMRTTTCAVPVHNTSTSLSFSPVQTATERTNSSNKSNSATVSKRLMSMRHHRQSSKQTKIKPDGVLVNHSLLLINEMFTLF